MGKIQRADLDGSGVRYTLHSGMARPNALALGGGYLYWTAASDKKIQRLDLDRSGAKDLITGVTLPKYLALDVDKMYWTMSRKIQRANLNGTGVEDIVTGLNSPQGVAIGPGN